MNSVRQKNLERWGLHAVLAIPLLYGLSFGPACWYGAQDRTTRNWIIRIYGPILDLRSQSPEVIQRAISGYANLGVGKDLVELVYGYIDYWYEGEE